MGKLTDKLDAVSAKLRKTTVKIDETAEAAKQAGMDAKAAADAKIEAAFDAADAKIEAAIDSGVARADAAEKAREERIDAAKQAGAEAKAEAIAKVDAAKQSVAEAKANAKKRQNETAEKIQGSIAEAKAKIEARKDARDRKKWEDYIISLLEYAEDCGDSAVILAAEAELAYLTAAAEIMDYQEKYGTDEPAE